MNEEAETSTRGEKPWGAYVVLEDARDHKIKRIEVRAGERLSYQRHAKRAEHWFIIAGRASVVFEGALLEVPTGQAIDIPLRRIPPGS